MLRGIQLGLILLFPSVLNAQEGSVAYTHSVQIEVSEEMRALMEARGGGREGRAGLRGGGAGAFPNQRVNEVVLLFNPTASLMKPVPRTAPQGPGRSRELGGRGGAVGARAGAMMGRGRMGSTNRAALETVIGAHTSFDKGTVVESREFLGREFLIEDERPAFAWRLTSETAEFLGYAVQKATAVQDSSTIEAWFTPQIPIPGGPGEYGGLPGMILVVTVDDGQMQYTATEVVMTAVAEDLIVPPTGGDRVTRDEYEKIVAEKLEELRMTRGGGQ
jgi:hypothetical protein